MWDMMVEAARSPALQWMVLGGAVGVFLTHVALSNVSIMGDVYSDELDG